MVTRQPNQLTSLGISILMPNLNHQIKHPHFKWLKSVYRNKQFFMHSTKTIQILKTILLIGKVQLCTYVSLL